MATIRVEFVKTHPNARMPEYAESQAAGADLFAPVDMEIVPFKATLVKTGLTLAYLEPGYEIQVRSRSGNALNKDFIIANGIGTVDSGYRSDVGVILKFLPPYIPFQEPDVSDVSLHAGNTKITRAILAHWEQWATTPLKIKAGDKIAQIVCKKVERMQFSEVPEVTDHTQRGAGGFGSTDKK